MWSLAGAPGGERHQLCYWAADSAAAGGEESEDERDDGDESELPRPSASGWAPLPSSPVHNAADSLGQDARGRRTKQFQLLAVALPTFVGAVAVAAWYRPRNLRESRPEAVQLLQEVLDGCTQRYQNCLDSRCCVDPHLTCFEKDESWAACVEVCSQGAHPEWDPPGFQTNWSCTVLSKLGDASAATRLVSDMEFSDIGMQVLDLPVQDNDDAQFGAPLFGDVAVQPSGQPWADSAAQPVDQPTARPWVDSADQPVAHEDMSFRRMVQEDNSLRAPRIPVYRGCYRNEGDHRIDVRFTGMTLAECAKAAEERGLSYLGMQKPNGHPWGHADCVLLEGMPPLSNADDIDCEVRVVDGTRLGGNFRMAGYRLVAEAELPNFPTPQPAPTNPPGTSLFCVEVVVENEKTLVDFQRLNGLSIFACDDNLVVHGGASERGNGQGQDHTASWTNVGMFVNAWREIREDGRYDMYDWTVKVDPDTVFVPWRLRTWLRGRKAPERGAYISTCGTCESGNGFYGAVEVISRAALQSYLWNMDQCLENYKDEIRVWGEDLFAQRCMDFSGVSCWEDSSDLVCDKLCGCEGGCDSGKAAYHPYKDADGFGICQASAK